MLFEQYQKCLQQSPIEVYKGFGKQKKMFMNFNFIDKNFNYLKSTLTQRQDTVRLKLNSENEIQTSQVITHSSTPQKHLNLHSSRFKSFSIDSSNKFNNQRSHLSDPQALPQISQFSLEDQQNIQCTSKTEETSSVLKSRAKIPEFCNVLFVDSIESLNDIRNNIVTVNIIKCFQACMRSEMKQFYSDEIVEIFNPIYKNILLNKTLDQEITPLHIKIFENIKTKRDYQQVIKICQLENMDDRLEDMFRYYFVPPSTYRSQILMDIIMEIKKQLQKQLNVYRIQVNHLTDFKGQHMTDILQLGWSNQLFYCSTSERIFNAQHKFIQKNFLNVVQNYQKYIFRKEALQNLNLLNGEINMTDQNLMNQAFKQQVTFQNLVRKKLPSIRQQVSIRLARQAQAIDNQEELSKMLQNLQLSKDSHLFHLTDEEIQKLLKIYPRLTNQDIFYYHSEFMFCDYKLMIEINSELGQGISKNIFEHFAIMFQLHNRTEMERVYNGLKINNFVKKIITQTKIGLVDWNSFLLLRVLIDERANKQHIIDFLYDYFDDEYCDTVLEVKVLYFLRVTAERITHINETLNISGNQRKVIVDAKKPRKNISKISKYFGEFLNYCDRNYRFFSESQQELLERCSIQVEQMVERDGSNRVVKPEKTPDVQILKFSDQFPLAVWSWMLQSGVLRDGVLHREQLMKEWDTNKYTLLLLVSCFLGEFYGNQFTFAKQLMK